MDKELTLDEMFTGLVNGKQYVLKNTLRSEWRLFQDGTLRYFVPGGGDTVYMDDLGDYIHYQHYGSSAIKVDKNELEWLLNTIFECKPSDFTELNHHALLDVINEGR